MDELKEELKNEIREQVFSKIELERLKREVKEELLNEKCPSFFNENPLITFALFTTVIIVLFKAFLN